MKRQSLLPATRLPQQVTRQQLPPPDNPSAKVSELSDPSIFTDLAASIADAPTINQVAGMHPSQPRVLHAQSRVFLEMPHSPFHKPKAALVNSTMARERLRELAMHWCHRTEVLRHPHARDAMQLLLRLVALPAEKGMLVHELQRALNTLSAILDPNSPVVRVGVEESLVPQDTLADNVDQTTGPPDLSAIVSDYLESEDPKAGVGLRGLARMLQDEFDNPNKQLDFGKFDATVVDDFEEAGGMEAFLQARVPMNPPLEQLTLSSDLNLLPAFLRQIPTLNELVLPDYDSATIDLSGMAALRTVCFSGEVPELETVVIPHGQTIRLENAEGAEITPVDTPANVIDTNDTNDTNETLETAGAAAVVDPTDP